MLDTPARPRTGSGRTTVFVVAGVVALAAVIAVAVLLTRGSESTPDAPAAAPPTPTAEAEVGMPTYRVGQEWQAGDWKVRVTGARCGSVRDLGVEGQELAGPEDACAVSVAYTNAGAVPAVFEGGSDAEPGPAYAVGMDAQGRSYSGWSWAQGETNPGLSGATDLVFAVPTGVTLTAVTIGDVAVQLG